MKRSTTIVLLLVAALTGPQPSTAGPGPPSPFPSEEEVQATGFAVWPEDTVEEAQEACTEHSDDQPWRLSPTATAKQFAKKILKHKNPYVDLEATDIGQHDARVWLYADEVDLSNIVELRRADVCWFITFGEPRESGESLNPVFVQEDGDLKVYFEHSTRTSKDFDELGFGEHTKTFSAGERPFRRSWVLPEGTDAEGHVLHLNWHRHSAETVSARKVPPPPEMGGGERVFPVGEHFSWQEIPENERRRTCRWSAHSGRSPRGVLNELLQWRFNRAMPSGPYPDVLHVGRRGWIGNHVFIAKLDEGAWNVRIDGISYRVAFSQATDDCWSLDKIRPRNKARPIEEVFYDETSATMDFNFQKAGSFSGTVQYGQDGGTALVHDDVPSRVAFYRAESDDEVSPGLLFVTLLKRGKYVNAFSRLLPPPGT